MHCKSETILPTRSCIETLSQEEREARREEGEGGERRECERKEGWGIRAEEMREGDGRGGKEREGERA